jgi:hypothetical protein
MLKLIKGGLIWISVSSVLFMVAVVEAGAAARPLIVEATVAAPALAAQYSNRFSE